MVEYERFGGKKMEKGGRQGGRINMRTANVNHEGMEGGHFLLLFSESENEDQRNSFPNDDLIYSLFLGVPVAIGYLFLPLVLATRSNWPF
jgi:hypothetical protein